MPYLDAAFLPHSRAHVHARSSPGPSPSTSSLAMPSPHATAALATGQASHLPQTAHTAAAHALRTAGDDGVAPTQALLMMTVLMLFTVVLTRHGTRSRWLTEASVACLLGLFAGNSVLLYYRYRTKQVPESLLSFSDDLFFDVCLPPIIFQAGFAVQAGKRRFFRNSFDIFLLGGLGTVVSFVLVSYAAYTLLPFIEESAFIEKGNKHHHKVHFQLSDALALGAVFSATDSVATLQVLDAAQYPTLFSLVFGEGIVNDATSIVLLSSIRHVHRVSSKTEAAVSIGHIGARFFFLLSASLALGVGVGLASAIILKSIFQQSLAPFPNRKPLFSPDHEVALVALLGFLAYILAEAIGLSAIFAVFFCGLTMSHVRAGGPPPTNAPKRAGAATDTRSRNTHTHTRRSTRGTASARTLRSSHRTCSGW